MAMIFTPDQAEAINERRGFVGPRLLGTTTRGGTYIIASAGKLNDDGLPHDLLAILPADLGQGRVIQLAINVNPALIDAVREALGETPSVTPCDECGAWGTGENPPHLRGCSHRQEANASIGSLDEDGI